MWSYFFIFFCYSFPSLSLPDNDFLCWLHVSYSSHSSVYFQHKQDWLLVSYFAACIISCVVCWEGCLSCPTRSIMYVVVLCCFICHSFLSLSLPGNDFLCWLHFSYYSSHSSVYFQHNQDWLHVPYFFAACIISSVVCWGGWFLKKNRTHLDLLSIPRLWGGKRSKRLSGIKGCNYKPFSWHLNRFPDADNIGSTA